MSGGVLFLYVDAKSVECNEAYEAFLNSLQLNCFSNLLDQTFNYV